MLLLPPAARPLREALALGPALLERARAGAVPCIAATLVEGPAVVLGAAQRAGRVLDLAACAAAGVAVHRRATTGTAVHLAGRAVLFTLALPHLAALAPDASPRTLLNRNVRGFLKGFTRAGALAHYFGREWISLRHRPAAVIGVDAPADGAALLEIWAGHDAALAIPEPLAAPEERALDRWLGKRPAALAELLPPTTSLADLAAAVLDGVTQRAPSPLVESSAPALDTAPYAPITNALDPLPAHHHPAALERVPIGWIEAARSPDGGVWLGGDVLTGRWLLDAIAGAADAPQIEPDALVLDGATLEDLLRIKRHVLAGSFSCKG